MATAVIVTGLAQVDAALAALEPKLQSKLTRKSMRAVAKQLVASTKSIIQAEAYNLGVLYRAFKVRALKRSRKRIGVAMLVDREKLISSYEGAYGHTPTPRKKDGDEPFYYLAAIELGYKRKDGTEVKAIRPMRRALYDNEEKFRQFFINDLRELIAEVGRKAA